MSDCANCSRLGLMTNSPSIRATRASEMAHSKGMKTFAAEMGLEFEDPGRSANGGERKSGGE